MPSAVVPMPKMEHAWTGTHLGKLSRRLETVATCKAYAKTDSYSDFQTAPYSMTFISYKSSSGTQDTFTSYGCTSNYEYVPSVHIVSAPASTSSVTSGSGISIGNCNSCNVGNNDNQTQIQNPDTSSKSGLSKGDIAGIVIGILTILIALAAFVMKCRRRKP
jgi:subtilase family serine protease